jgi:chloride channel 7
MSICHVRQARIFAIMGSAAFVGGISRMVLSMTVIMLEATGDLFFLLPFAIVLIVSHWVGDMFNPSIYEMIIQMKNYPFLRPDPPKWAIG